MDFSFFRPGNELQPISRRPRNVHERIRSAVELPASGKGPDKTVFVVEERGSRSEGSINRTWHFQTDLMGMGVEVKDESRFPEKWAYFSFGADTKAAGANPKAACRQCHDDHAAAEHTSGLAVPPFAASRTEAWLERE